MGDLSPLADSPSCEDPIQELRIAFPFCGYIDGAEHRAITVQQLWRVISYATAHCAKWTDNSPNSQTRGQNLSEAVLNLYHVNTFLILPATREDDCSCVELMSSEPQDPLWFVSHWWGERVSGFLECIECHVKTRGLKDEAAFWICAYANRQNSLLQEITEDPRTTSFFKAMQLARGVLLILDGKSDAKTGPATPFTRSWCAFEVSMAVLELKKPIDVTTLDAENGPAILTEGYTDFESKMEKKTPGWGSRAKSIRESIFPIDIMAAGLEVAIESASATSDEDRIRILNSIAERSDLEQPPLEKHANYAKVNKRLRAVFALAVWFQAVQKGGKVEMKKLAKAVVEDEWRKAILMNFAFCARIDDYHVAVVASALHKKLVTLELHFWMCNLIGNSGLRALAKALPPTLEALTLNFQLCTRLTHMGIDVLGLQLPLGLVSLRLNFEFNSSIRSVLGLARGIARLSSLRLLDLDLGALDSLDDNQLTDIADAFPAKLRNLYLSFKGCHFIGSRGVAALAYRLPHELTVLNFNFSNCDRISDSGLQSVAYYLPKTLMVFHLSLLDCTHITKEAVIPLVKRLPSSLHGAKFFLAGTSVPENIQKICRHLDSMREWAPQLAKSGDRHAASGLRADGTVNEGRMLGRSLTSLCSSPRFTTHTIASTARWPIFGLRTGGSGEISAAGATTMSGSLSKTMSPALARAAFNDEAQSGKDSAMKRTKTSSALKSPKPVLPQIVQAPNSLTPT
ncbi:unnamed protein product [Polarella glacialis]|uniref:Uncharacterized protein n=1 Tax=Polarella glacialis TaxID=89957 RepID=A0A813KX35_POLGL|nr:unnamed protein product [Polarella glacialis]